ncbi:MAG: hypothetical protein A2W90_01540 [Bacteroidetes bacterium GWF2_42_66]|nr:MAG: hypothetical protein A2W92_11845 [Bacteroidetes bacterium GWA2_42_15]OFY01054.1 MAG: hypothetical protein A2W89_15025 [Bacteroidetes bacterium GWE2_42_39]OFY41897.1 MAG: hypothetical protein A2W90_01540 [Bacteroidetes bacterium GWF2_42_66]HBL77925.1 hypothetical protein [Prolixibacteraceae bacterium]HCR90148.1 hypothetical protein [Prolixibacteraceae bacterium]
MQTRNLLFALFAISPFLFQSCSAPKSLIKVEPTQESTKWLYGQEFAKDSVSGIIYEVGFDRIVEPNYLFDFDITNRSNLEILIDPKDFYYQPLNDSLQPMVDEYFHASDPEEEILNIEKKLSITEARRKSHIALSLVGLGVDIAAAAITVSDNNPHNDYLRTDLFNAVQIGNMANEFEAVDLNELHESWSQSTIRKTTLEPGYSMKGKVFFPFFPNAKYLQLVIPIDDQNIEILFQQKYIPVKR